MDKKRLREGSPSPLIYYLQAAAYSHLQTLADQNGSQLDAIQVFPFGHALSQKQVSDMFASVSTSGAQLSAMLSGLDKWRQHPYFRKPDIAPVLWKRGPVRLLDYGEPDARPVLVIPSLINRYYILDLMEGGSFMRHMAAQGLRPIVLDWGESYELDGPKDLSACVTDFVIPAAEFLVEMHGNPVSVLGYCMGGTLAVALTVLEPKLIDRLALIGTPWNFHAQDGVAAQLRSYANSFGSDNLRKSIRAMGDTFGAVPLDIFQQLFAILAPIQVLRKFSAFDQLYMESLEAQKFVAIEDWLADGTPLGAGVTEELFADWYLENLPGRSKWKIGGGVIDPQEIACPTLIFSGQRDQIVPYAMSADLTVLIEGCEAINVDTGHVGMIVSGKAKSQVADRLCSFYTNRTVGIPKDR